MSAVEAASQQRSQDHVEIAEAHAQEADMPRRLQNAEAAKWEADTDPETSMIKGPGRLLPDRGGDEEDWEPV